MYVSKNLRISLVWPMVDFWAAKGGPYIVFTFTGSVRNVRNDVNIYIYIYIYIYIHIYIYIYIYIHTVVIKSTEPCFTHMTRV